MLRIERAGASARRIYQEFARKELVVESILYNPAQKLAVSQQETGGSVLGYVANAFAHRIRYRRALVAARDVLNNPTDSEVLRSKRATLDDLETRRSIIRRVGQISHLAYIPPIVIALDILLHPPQPKYLEILEASLAAELVLVTLNPVQRVKRRNIRTILNATELVQQQERSN